MHFIKLSLLSALHIFCSDIDRRKELYNPQKTPKRVFSFWFFIILLGQVGILTSILWSGISGDGMMGALVKQAKAGNFLTFEISLILSCLVYYFEEYGGREQKELLFLRSTLLVAGMLIAFLAMVNYIFINDKPLDYYWSCAFAIYNIALYVSGIAISYSMYITFSVVEVSAKEANDIQRENQINAAQAVATTTRAVIGNRQINL